jgi:hypothetical protein
MGDTANKIAGIFVDAMADAAFDEIKLSESEKVDKAIKTVKGALDKAHAGILARAEAKPLHSILSNYCREEAISLIDRKVKKYEKFINATTPITGRWVIYSENPYADKTDEFIQNDIKFTILIVYFAAVTEESMKTAISRSLKGIFGVFKNDSSKEMEGAG